MEKLFYAGLLAALIAGSYAMAFKYGEFTGSTKVSAEWQQENDDRDKAYTALEKKNASEREAHQQREKELGDELATATATYQATLNGFRSDYDHRLLLAEGRAGVYQRQARGSADEQQRLARHAAELDRALEEGRALVRELGETVRQRDRTIFALGQIILNDRTLFTGEPNGL